MKMLLTKNLENSEDAAKTVIFDVVLYCFDIECENTFIFIDPWVWVWV